MMTLPTKHKPRYSELYMYDFGMKNLARQGKTMILNDMRRRIDEVDRELVRLLNKRAQIAKDISTIKLEVNLPLRDFIRESKIIYNVTEGNPGPLEYSDIREIYRAILNACLRTE